MLDRSRGPYVGMPESFVESEFNTNQLAVFDAYLATGVSDLAQILDASNGAVDAAGQLRDPVGEALVDHADGLVDDANQQKQTTIVLAATLVVLALGITLYASRSITNPLRSLTRQAADMASSRLPRAVQSVLDTPAGEDVVVPEVAPIAVNTRDEVADVAAALNTVQTSALDLAVEQAALRKNIADSFVNLGRRNQNLLDRQLEMITDLERQEQQPDRLEDLFLLDHLATRMRRNAESLLRLAGGGDTTNSGWGGPVPIIDLVRGALGEVEEYERVDVHAMEPVLVQAAAGSDLAHAIAELVENALHFSPDDERVIIRGRTASDGGYTLAIIDQGMGMDDEQLAVANRRLAGEESFTVAPSRYLGHYIAGHLAAGIGLRISLTTEAIGGIVARVDIPAELIVDSRTAVDTYESAPAPAPGPGTQARAGTRPCGGPVAVRLQRPLDQRAGLERPRHHRGRRARRAGHAVGDGGCTGCRARGAHADRADERWPDPPPSAAPTSPRPPAWRPPSVGRSRPTSAPSPRRRPTMSPRSCRRSTAGSSEVARLVSKEMPHEQHEQRSRTPRRSSRGCCRSSSSRPHTCRAPWRSRPTAS